MKLVSIICPLIAVNPLLQGRLSRVSSHYVRIQMTNDRKIKHSLLLFICHQNHNRNQGKKEFLNSHDGQKSYLLTCTGHSAHMGWRAGTGQQVTFLAIVGIQKFLFSLIPITILKVQNKKLGMYNFFAICYQNSHTVVQKDKNRSAIYLVHCKLFDCVQ